MLARVRRVGTSLIVTIPKEEAEKLALSEGTLVNIYLQKMELRPVVAPERLALYEQILEEGKDVLEYLRDK
jgi:antitoxin component of MazEF toxin-antitoxin module